MGRGEGKPMVKPLSLLTMLLLLHGSYAQRNNTRQGRTNRCKNNNAYQLTGSDLTQQPLTLACPKGPVVDVNITGIKGRCRGTSPDFLTERNRCSWNTTCTLTFRGQPLDIVQNARNDNCVGQVPDTLEVTYTCLKNKVSISDVMGNVNRTRNKEGIARSHLLYPWTYRNGQPLGNLTFVKPNRPDLVNLWFTVYSFAILDSDLVFLTWEGNSDRQHQVDAYKVLSADDTTFKIQGVRSVTLTFFADYTDHYSIITGQEKGFVICYLWLKASGRPQHGSACSRSLQPGVCQRGSARDRGSASSSTTPNRNRNRNGLI